MKRNITIITCVLLVCAASLLMGNHFGINNNKMSDIMLLNAEAIARGEGTLSGPSWTDVCGSYNPKTGERCEEWFTWCGGTDIDDPCSQTLCPDHQK